MKGFEELTAVSGQLTASEETNESFLILISVVNNGFQRTLEDNQITRLYAEC